jgi:hypothetical protein
VTTRQKAGGWGRGEERACFG